MTVIYEHREVDNRVLLMKFVFQSHKGQYSLDKYLGYECWKQIFRKLECQLDKYKSNIKCKLDDTVISMTSDQLELQVSWKKVSPAHKEIAYEEINTKNCDLCPFVLVTKVSMVSALNRYKKKHCPELDKTDRPASTKTKSTKTETNGEKRSTNHIDEYVPEEYVPEATSNFEMPKYTPSTLTNRCDPKSDEYDPSELSNAMDEKSEVVVYTPTKIDKPKPRSYVKKTDENRNDYTDKKKRNNKDLSELFGGSSDEHETEINLPSSRLLRSTNKETSKQIKQQVKIDNYFSPGNMKKNDDHKENDRSNDTKKKRKLNTVTPIDEEPYMPVSKDEESKKLRKLRQEWEEKEKQISIGRTMYVEDMDFDEINDTFKCHEEVLGQMFQQYMRTPDYTIHPKQCDILILNELITQSQLTNMYKTLRSKFDANNKSVTSNHEQLLWTVLAPEWALQIFMKKFSFGRDAAIAHLKNQEEARRHA